MTSTKLRKHFETHPEEKQIHIRKLLKEENIFKVNIPNTRLKHAPYSACLSLLFPRRQGCLVSNNKLRKMAQKKKKKSLPKKKGFSKPGKTWF